MLRRGLAVLLVALGLAAIQPARPAAAVTLNSPVVAMAVTPGGGGYWEAARDGGVFAFGDASFLGSMGGTPLNRPVVGMAGTSTGRGYWLVASDGGVFSFGDAAFRGSTGDIRLNSPIVGMAVTPSGAGYWMVAADGGIFSFGDAGFRGSTGDIRLNSPIVGMAVTPSGGGYWMVARDGGVFAFGDALFAGSMGGSPLNSPVVGMAAAPSGGYWLVAADGGIFAFGGAPFAGSAGDITLNSPIVGMAPAGTGYHLVAADGGIFSFGATFRGSPQDAPPAPSGPPALSVATHVSGLDQPWDLAFAPDGALLFTEAVGRISAFVDGQRRVLATVPDVDVDGEGGLLGMTLDPAFSSNRTLYACYNSTAGDVRMARWVVDSQYTSATRTSLLFTGAPANTSGRHSGCRPRFGPDGFLYVGTGDAAQPSNPQNLSSLGGKVLRVNASTGAVSVHTYGHRNVQGLAWRPGTTQLFAVEHGPDRDDEVNLIRAGANYGWDPSDGGGGYNESVPMTDLTEFPDAVPAVWSSGSPTIAPSGATFLSGPQWKAWDGAFVMACLKGQQLRVLFLDSAGTLTGQTSSVTNQGRLRQPMQGPDGALYVSTDGTGTSGRILRITPS